MSGQSDALTHPQFGSRTGDLAAVYQEGIVAGILGAATIAVWHLIVDAINGHPLFTPTVIGTALFRGGEGLDSPGTLPVSLEMVLVATWVHFLVFGVIGGVASRLLTVAEQSPNLGFGMVLLLVFFEFGFIAAAMAFAQPVLHALAWPTVLVGNVFGAAAMVAYFWRRHPRLRIEP